MKLHQLIMLAAFLQLPLSLQAQQSYTIKGTIGKLNPPAKAILTYKKNGERVFDSTEIKKWTIRIPRSSPVAPRKRT